LIHLSIPSKLSFTSIHMSKIKLKIKKPIKRPTCFQSAQTMFGTTLCFTMSVRVCVCPRHVQFRLEKDTFKILLYNTVIVSKVSI
jgi:hypothetical protein